MYGEPKVLSKGRVIAFFGNNSELPRLRHTFKILTHTKASNRGRLFLLEGAVYKGVLLLWLLLIAYLIGVAPLRFHIAYANQGIDDHFLLEMVFFHVFRWKKEISLIRPRLERWGVIAKLSEVEPEANQKKTIRETSTWPVWVIVESARKFQRRLIRYGLGVALLSLFLPRRYLSYIHVVEAMENRGHFTRFQWYTRIGSKDAALTAWGIGAVWGVKGQIIGYLQQRYAFRAFPVLKVAPVFGEGVLDTRIDCIFELKVGHIISVGFKEWIKLLFAGRRERS